MDEIRKPKPSSGDTCRAPRLYPAVERLDADDCWKLLREASDWRLAIAAVGDIDVFPINFAVDGNGVVFRTSEGTKLIESVISDLVAIEADDRDPIAGEAWSVVIKGGPHPRRLALSDRGSKSGPLVPSANDAVGYWI